ncbi:MAG: glycosyltransferase family 2 protein [Bacteriovoracaceae bacterium]|jgi:glycosyltransferase involved in cell wall biosynthesis|nr:glycosyltransferase family 2 protein [Bacteriovoracaceae bacterium]
MKTTLVILTYNEIVGLKETFSGIPMDAVDEVFAVDGGSTDGSLEFFKENGVTCHIQDVKGRGEAFRLAFEKATGDALIFYSPDGNETAADIFKFKPYLDDGYDIVIGNRMSDGGHNEEDGQFLKIRKWANNFFTLIANVMWNRGDFVYDTINGFRAITRSAWERISLDGPGYTIEYQSSIRAFKLGLKIKEFPTYEGQRIDEQEGSPSIETGLSFLKLFFREIKVGQRWKLIAPKK